MNEDIFTMLAQILEKLDIIESKLNNITCQSDIQECQYTPVPVQECQQICNEIVYEYPTCNEIIYEYPTCNEIVYEYPTCNEIVYEYPIYDCYYDYTLDYLIQIECINEYNCYPV